MSAWLLEHAWLGDGAHATPLVRVEVEGGRFTRVEPGGSADGAIHLPGLTIPGLANTHSHVFHRALRARTDDDSAGGGSFWTWRTRMYDVAQRLTPERLHALARATYREMVAAGITAVGEFHYVHHRPDGSPYATDGVPDHAMEQAVVAAAAEAGIALTLLDTCYLTGGVGEPLTPEQVRFGDGDADGWRRRVEDLATRLPAEVVLGAAIHSVRAVPPAALPVVADWAAEHAAPLHVHLSEQPAENAAALAAWGRTPTALLAEAGALGSRTTVVHATHLTPDDISTLGAAGCALSLCPTTERDLADGIGPARALVDAGVRLTLGSDAHAVIDLFEEARATEMHERLRSGRRGHWTPAALLAALTADGHAALGRDAGRIAVGQPADLVTVSLHTPRTAGAAPGAAAVVHAATAADVTFVLTRGEVRVPHGGAAGVAAEVGAELAGAIEQLGVR